METEFTTPHAARKQQQFRPAQGFFGNNPAINPPGACKNNYAGYLRRKTAMQQKQKRRNRRRKFAVNIFGF